MYEYELECLNKKGFIPGNPGTHPIFDRINKGCRAWKKYSMPGLGSPSFFCVKTTTGEEKTFLFLPGCPERVRRLEEITGINERIEVIRKKLPYPESISGLFAEMLALNGSGLKG